MIKGFAIGSLSRYTRTSFAFSRIHSQKMVTFDEMGVDEVLCKALKGLNFLAPTEVQQMSFGDIIAGNDVIMGGETGSGKTLAYMLPLLQKSLNSTGPPKVAVLVPNKHLVEQVISMSKPLVDAVEVSKTKIGFLAKEEDISNFLSSTVPHFGVTTPAIVTRYMKYAKKNSSALQFSDCIDIMVLDEADMLLEGSFHEEIQLIMEHVKKTRRALIAEGKLKVNQRRTQIILSAATIPSYGMKSVEKVMTKMFPFAKHIQSNMLHTQHPLIHQRYIKVADKNPFSESRIELLLNAIRSTPELLQNQLPSKQALYLQRKQAEAATNGSAATDPLASSDAATPASTAAETAPAVKSIMIFYNTAANAARGATILRSKGIECVEYHSQLHHLESAKNLDSFRRGETPIMVCTDHASRGLNIPLVYHVIQAEFAENVVRHIHRIGRASRGGRVGMATNFHDPSNSVLMNTILKESKGVPDSELFEGSTLRGNSSRTSVDAHGNQVTEVIGLGLKTAEDVEDSQSLRESFSRRRGLMKKHKRMLKKELTL